MQPDRRLIEDVHHPGQSRADLARQPDTLGLATGERVGTAIERQIVEANIDQKTQSVFDLANDLACDFAAPTGDLQACKEIARIGDRKAGDLR